VIPAGVRIFVGIEPVGYAARLRSPGATRARAPRPIGTKTLEQRETQQKLDANVFRRVVLGLPVGSANHAPELHQPDDAARRNHAGSTSASNALSTAGSNPAAKRSRRPLPNSISQRLEAA
jgi:hypothetical protein